MKKCLFLVIILILVLLLVPSGCLAMRSHPGTLKWKYETGYYIESSPAIGSDGTIYVGAADNYLYAIRGSSGGLADSTWPMFHHDVKHSGRKSE